MAALTLLVPYSPIDEFGTGRLRTKVITLLVSTTFLSIGAWYRCGITWQIPVPRAQPFPWDLGKGPFYILNFLFEIQTVIMYAILRVDQRWHIPNGAKGPGSYSKPPQQPSDLEMQDSRPTTPDDTSVFENTRASDDSTKSSFQIEINIVKLPPLSPIVHPANRSRPNSSQLSLPLSSHPTSRHQSLLQQILTGQPSASQKREWRASEESRIVRRLGGPWSQLPSPTESVFSHIHTQHSSPTRSEFSEDTGISARTGVSREAPSIRDTLHEADWTPEINFDLASPRRFLSLKKRSISLLR
jgi:hypothetical protein